MNQQTINIQDLVVKTQEETVIDGISFALQPGEHLAVLGAAGCGKTLLARAIAGKAHSSGHIAIGTQRPRTVLVEQRHSFRNLSGMSDFYYQQRFNSFDAENAPSVLDELTKAAQESGNGTDRLDVILRVLGIGHLKHAPLIQLSSGEHKRFQLARALANPPGLLILDTPYTALDTEGVRKFNDFLAEIAAKGTRVILIPGTFPVPGFISHIAFLEDKKLRFFGPKKEFTADETGKSDRPPVFHSRLLPASLPGAPQETVVNMKEVAVTYGDRTVFKGLDWKIRSGEKWLLKGQNGSGKSSLLSMIAGDHPQAYANDISLFGKRRGSGESIWDIKRRIGFISPELHAYFDQNVTCFQAVGSGYFDTIGLYKKLSTEQYDTILQWLDFLQVSHVSTKPLHSISASLQRMILLARALVKNPPLLILDEPCQGLDDSQCEQFLALVDAVCSNPARTLIYVSHEENRLPCCIEKVLTLESGGYRVHAGVESALPAVA